MLTHLSLRLRIFLFFCLLALGAIAVSLGSLWLSFERAATPALLDPFIFAGLLGTFAILGLCAGIWLLFDENVAKPIEILAAEMRLRAHGGVSRGIDAKTARYLGDLAPAAAGQSLRQRRRTCRRIHRRRSRDAGRRRDRCAGVSRSAL